MIGLIAFVVLCVMGLGSLYVAETGTSDKRLEVAADAFLIFLLVMTVITLVLRTFGFEGVG